jgi:hypothetical protein
MRGLALLTGIIAFLSMVMGILTFSEVGFLQDIPLRLTNYEFWFWISALLFLITIALGMVHRREE